jgi:hypothetical protein
MRPTAQLALEGYELHFAIYDLKTGKGRPDPDAFALISNVPLPAAAWLCISALGGLVVAKRKKLKA